MLTIFGALAVAFMMVVYALERRGRGFELAFGSGCALASAYGLRACVWPSGDVESIWALVDRQRFTRRGPIAA